MANIKKITAIITAVIGIIVTILGVTLMGETANHAVDDNSFRYVAENYNADYASFGADFYTYIYGASDTIVDELNDINKAMETVVKAQNSINAAVTANVLATDDLIDTVNHVGGMIVIAIGLSILAYAVQKIGVAFAPVVDEKNISSAAEVVEEHEEDSITENNEETE